MEHNDQVVQAGVRLYGCVRIVELEIGGETKEDSQNLAGPSPCAPVIWPITHMFFLIRNSALQVTKNSKNFTR